MNIGTIGIGRRPAQIRRETGYVSMSAGRAAAVDELQRSDTERKAVDPNEVSSAAEEIQKLGNMFDVKLQFQVNEELNQVVVKVIDTNTEKVIREIPSEEIQRLQKQIRETVGLLFDETI